VKDDHEARFAEEPRTAPEPETAEERSKRTGLKTGGGIVAGGAVAAAKVGVLGKVFVYLFLWNGVSSAWRIGGWIGIALVAAGVAMYFVVRARRASET
jgi:uncharacterized membrane protein